MRPTAYFAALALLLLFTSGCIQRDREEYVEEVEAPLPEQQPFNTRMPRTVAPDQAMRMLTTDEDIVLVDVRDGNAWSQGIILGAIHLPEELVAANALREFPDYDARILLYSLPGRGSILAATTMRKLGYRNVGRLHGTWEQWQEVGLPIGPPTQKSRFLFAAEEPIDNMVDTDQNLPPEELPYPEEAPQVESPEASLPVEQENDTESDPAPAPGDDAGEAEEEELVETAV